MIVALVVACAFFLETFTGTVITTALPAMAATFGTDPVRASLGITVYMLTLAIFIPVSGWIADRHGGRTVFRAAIAVFTVASVLCGLSDNLAELVLARMVQGIGGAMMVPVGRLVMLRSVPRSDYVRAMAWLVVPAFVGPVVGPPVGGFITTFVSWRWVFFLNVPIGLVGMVLATVLIKNDRETEARPFDWLGFALTAVSLGALLYSLDLLSHGSMADGALFLALFVGGSAIGWLAVRHALRHPSPLLDFALFRHPTFALSVWGGMFWRLSAGSVPFLLPVFLQVGLGMTAFASGLLILADGLGNLLMNAVAPAMIRRWGFRRVLVTNGVAAAFAVGGGCAVTADTSMAIISAAYFLFGFLRSLQYNALSTIQYAEIEPAEMSAATSFTSTVQQICQGAGIALGAVLMQLSLLARGAGPASLGTADLRFAFLAEAVLALGAIPFFRRLENDAGAELSGHRVASAPSGE